MFSARLVVCLLAVNYCALTVLSQDSFADKKEESLKREKELIDQVFTDYKSSHLPPPQEGVNYSSVVITVNAYIYGIEVDDDDAEIRMFFRQEWVDSRLTFEEKEEAKEGMESERVTLSDTSKVWLPDTYFTNVEKVKDTKRHYVRFDADGYLLYSQDIDVESFCTAGPAYPLANRVVCSMKFGSYKYTFDNVAYAWRKYKPITFDPDMDGGYELVDSETSRCEGNFSVGLFGCLEMKLTFEGSCYQACAFIFIPSLLLLFCSWLHFWIHGSWTVPRTMSAVVPFAIFVAVLFYEGAAEEDMGSGSALLVWLLFCVILTFLSLCEYFLCICMGVHKVQQGEHNKPLLTDEQAEDGPSTKKPKRRGLPKDGGGLDFLSRFLFPLIFIIFLIIYLCVYLTM